MCGLASNVNFWNAFLMAFALLMTMTFVELSKLLNTGMFYMVLTGLLDFIC